MLTGAQAQTAEQPDHRRIVRTELRPRVSHPHTELPPEREQACAQAAVCAHAAGDDQGLHSSLLERPLALDGECLRDRVLEAERGIGAGLIVELSIAQQVMVLGLCILGSIGTAGVPAGSLPVIAMILTYLHVPPEGIGIILGVDRFLDMCRTALNVTGDLATAVVVSRHENEDAVRATAPVA